MKHILILFFVCLGAGVSAQDFSFGKVKATDFDTHHILLDSSSSGIVLNEYGYANVELSPVADRGFEIEYYYHTLIKIINKEGYEQANFTIPLYISNNRRETLVDVKGITYNLEGGKLEKTELSKENIITENTSETLNLVKIAFPKVKEGAIVELRYKTSSPFLFNMNAWTFQTDIPKIRSEFVTRIPEICTYRVNLKGGLPLTDRKIENYDTGLTSGVGTVRGDRTTYIMKDIPAFVSEDYMTASKNFTSILTFELARYSIPFGPNETFSLTWNDVQKSLLTSEDFGGQLKRKNQLKEFITPVIEGATDDFDKAHKIFSYVKKQVKWNKRHSIYTSSGIKKAFETQMGNSADMNLGLVNALNYAGLTAEAVILSTRDNGYPGIYSAVISEFNHVIARVQINDQYYFLDATAPYEPFGNLPLKCINYQGRVIPLEGTSDWVPLQCNLIAALDVLFDGEINEEGTLVGKLVINRGGYTASNKRNVIDSYNSLEEYFEDNEKKLAHMEISNPQLSNKENSEILLKEEMDIEIADFAVLDNGEIHFNPIIFGRTDKNPFNLDKRTYPVDIGSKIHEQMMFIIRVPEGYVLSPESLNTKTNIALPNRDARFIYNVLQDGTSITAEVLTQINKPLFLPDEYFNLKEFFSRIIRAQSKSLILQKGS